MSGEVTEKKVKAGQILAAVDDDLVGCSVMISYSRRGLIH